MSDTAPWEDFGGGTSAATTPSSSSSPPWEDFKQSASQGGVINNNATDAYPLLTKLGFTKERAAKFNTAAQYTPFALRESTNEPPTLASALGAPTGKVQGPGAAIQPLLKGMTMENIAQLPLAGKLLLTKGAGAMANLSKAFLGAVFAKSGAEQLGTVAGKINVTGLPATPINPLPEGGESLVLLPNGKIGKHKEVVQGTDTDRYENLGDLANALLTLGGGLGMGLHTPTEAPTGITPTMDAGYSRVPEERQLNAPGPIVPQERQLPRFAQTETEGMTQPSSGQVTELRSNTGSQFVTDSKGRTVDVSQLTPWEEAKVMADIRRGPEPLQGPPAPPWQTQKLLPPPSTQVEAGPTTLRQTLQNVEGQLRGENVQLPGQTQLRRSGVEIDPEDLRPAINFGGRILVGQQGDTHADILKKNALPEEVAGFTSPDRGFVSAKEPDKFMSRLEAQAKSGLKGTTEAPGGGLDSMDLPGAAMHKLTREYEARDKQAQRQRAGTKLYSGVPLPELPEGASKLFLKAFNHVFGMGVDRSFKEGNAALAAKSAGWSVPRHVAAAEDVGNKLVEYAAADITAPQMAKALATEALGDRYKDKAFDEKLGKTVVEERLRAIEEQTKKPVTHVLTDAEFNRNLADPEIKAAIERHKEVVQAPAEQAHAALGGKLAATGGRTGVFVNLEPISKLENFEDAKKVLYGGTALGNVQMRGVVKPSVFNKPAQGVSQFYETSYRNVAERMIEGNYKRNALRSWIDEGVKAGVYKYAETGENAVTIGGQPAVRIPVKIKGTPWGAQVVKDLWVRKDLAPEVTQALNGTGVAPKSGAQFLLNLATEAQIIGPTDFVFHTGNMFSSIVGSLGAKTEMGEIARRITGVKQLDAVGRIGYNLYKVILDSPDIQRELAEISKIGALRSGAEQGSSTLLAKATGGVLDTGRWIRLIDRAGRLARNHMFNNLVERGLVKDNPLDRREFINKMGQYNERLMSQFQGFMRQYFSQFVVAGRTFNRNAFQRVLLKNEVRAASPEAFWKMKALNMVGLFSSLLVIPVVLNSVLTGQPFGRKGTPVGKIDTGKDDDQGRHITIDPGQTELVRRGLRVSGGQALFKGISEGQDVTKIAFNMAGDIVKGQLQPWEGPPVRMGMAAMQKYAESRDMAESLKAAMLAANPTITSYFAPKEGDKGGVKGVATSLAGSVGVGKTGFPKHEERVQEVADKAGLDLSDFDQRLAAEAYMKETREPMTEQEKVKSAQTAMKNMSDRRQAVMNSLSKEDKQWLKVNHIEPPGFGDYLEKGKVRVPYTDQENKFATEMYKSEYENVISFLRNDSGFKQLSANEQQLVANEAFRDAAKRAREQTEQVVQSGQLVPKKKKRFSAFSQE